MLVGATSRFDRSLLAAVNSLLSRFFMNCCSSVMLICVRFFKDSMGVRSKPLDGCDYFGFRFIGSWLEVASSNFRNRSKSLTLKSR